MKRTSCPNGCDLTGELIAAEHFDPALHDINRRHHDDAMARYGRCFCLPYGDLPEDERFYSRMIGVTVNDRIAEWLCPDCGIRWDR